MDREWLFTSLSLAGALLAPLVGLFRRRPCDFASGRAAERAAWRALWAPLLPTGACVAFLIGWGLSAPDPAERPPLDAIVLPLLGAALALRAAWRAWQAAAAGVLPSLGVVGVLRPRIHVDARVEGLLDEEALAAALAHERAHLSHRDPLRILLANLATDLQLGLPGARERLSHWRHVLELARDEQARAAGADGGALARAILVILRHEVGAMPITARLAGDGERLRDRVVRLLAPLPPVMPARPVLPRLAGALVATILLGMLLGEPVLTDAFG